MLVTADGWLILPNEVGLKGGAVAERSLEELSGVLGETGAS